MSRRATARERPSPASFGRVETVRTFAPEIVALLLGGLASSLGAVHLLRMQRARPILARLRGWTIAVVCGALVVIGVGGAVWQARSSLVEGGIRAESISVPRLFLFGFLVGMPMSLPGVIFAWSEARGRDRSARRRKDFVATKDDRRKFAEDLVRQIQDVSPKPRKLTASVGGEGGRVLVFEGEIDATEGERLTAALRADLQALGFERVEGGDGSTAWWSRV